MILVVVDHNGLMTTFQVKIIPIKYIIVKFIIRWS